VNLLIEVDVRDDEYLFPPEWQEMIHDAEEDIREDRVREAENANEMIKQLNEA
jgi:hypothetical protein